MWDRAERSQARLWRYMKVMVNTMMAGARGGLDVRTKSFEIYPERNKEPLRFHEAVTCCRKCIRQNRLCNKHPSHFFSVVSNDKFISCSLICPLPAEFLHVLASVWGPEIRKSLCQHFGFVVAKSKKHRANRVLAVKTSVEKWHASLAKASHTVKPTASGAGM